MLITSLVWPVVSPDRSRLLLLLLVVADGSVFCANETGQVFWANEQEQAQAIITSLHPAPRKQEFLSPLSLASTPGLGSDGR